jgi:hypothetical protein
MSRQFNVLALAAALSVHWVGGIHAAGPMNGGQQRHANQPQARQRQAMPARQPTRGNQQAQQSQFYDRYYGFRMSQLSPQTRAAAQRSPFNQRYYGPQQSRSPGAQGSLIRGAMIKEREDSNRRSRQRDWPILNGVRIFMTDPYPDNKPSRFAPSGHTVRTGVKG